MLELSHLKKSYNKNEVLTDVNYIFNKGQLYPILGGLSSGRTTLLECIAGDIPIDGGTVTTHTKSHIFLASKQSIFPIHITGYAFICMLCDLNKGSSKPEYYLDKAGISQTIRDMHIGEYSFEDKKRLQLAAFLVQKPYVILFDEPFDYCSDSFIDDYIKVLNEMKDTHIIIITTGLLEIARRISPDTVILNNGELNMVSEETMNIPEIKQAVLDILGEADNEII